MPPPASLPLPRAITWLLFSFFFFFFSFFYPPSCWTTRSGFHVIIAAHELQLIRDDSCKSFAPCLPVQVVVYRVYTDNMVGGGLGGGVAADRDRDLDWLDVRVSLAAPVYYSVNSLKLPSARTVWGCSTPRGPSCTPPVKLATLSVIVAMRHATRR